jgi:hypothetical protein
MELKIKIYLRKLIQIYIMQKKMDYNLKNTMINVII